MTPFHIIFLALIAGVMAGCISSDSGTGAAPFGQYNQATQSSAVTLSGTIIRGDAAAALNNPTSTPPVGSALAGMLVMAVDEYGNSQTTSGDNSGHFTFSGLTPNTNYSLIFIDRRTLEVVASLTARATGSTGALSLQSDTDLRNIVVDPATGKALSAADLSGELQIVDGSAFDADQDGNLDRDDTSSLQAKTLQAGGEQLTTISLADYMGVPGSWSLNFVLYDHDSANGCSWIERRAHVVRAREVNGPSGKQVEALKRGYVHYFDGETGVDCYLPYGGYYDESYGSDPYIDWGYPDENDLLTEPPAEYNPEGGLWGSASYTYIDNQGGWIMLGDRDDSSSVVWDANAKLPLNAELGVDTVIVSESWLSMDFTFSIRVDTVTNEDGTPAIVTDAFGLKLPVIRVTLTYRESDRDDPTWGYAEVDQSYMLAKYGVRTPAHNRWDLFMGQTRFGLILDDGTLLDATPTTIGSVTLDPQADPFPDAPTNGSALTLSELRQAWINFVDTNLANLDAYVKSNQQLVAASDYFWQEDVLNIPSWDEATFDDYYYQANSMQRSDGTDYSGTVFTLPITYHGTATAYFEWQAWDDVNGGMVALNHSAPLQITLDDPACDATVDECAATVVADSAFVFPVYTDVTAYTAPWMAAVWNGTEYIASEVVDVGLALVLVDADGYRVYEESVDWYYLMP